MSPISAPALERLDTKVKFPSFVVTHAGIRCDLLLSITAGTREISNGEAARRQGRLFVLLTSLEISGASQAGQVKPYEKYNWQAFSIAYCGSALTFIKEGRSIKITASVRQPIIQGDNGL